jgi:Predicted membrane protein (DUF2306)
MSPAETAPDKSSVFKWVVLYGLCFIGAAAALRRIAVLLFPLVAPRAPQLASLDAAFAARSTLTLLHIVPALFFVVLLPWWFSMRLRQNRRAHRQLTWVLFILGAVVGLTALPLVARPVGGTTEVAAILFFDSIFLFSLGRAWLLFLRGEAAQYRDWMMRAISVLLGIATTRPVMGVFFATARLTHLEPHQFFGIAFWIGFTATYLAGEAYLHKHPVPSEFASQT